MTYTLKFLFSYILVVGFALAGLSPLVTSAQALNAAAAVATAVDGQPGRSIDLRSLVTKKEPPKPSPAERRCQVAETACQKRCVRTTKGTGSKGAKCAQDCTDQFSKCWKDAPGPQ